VGGRERGREGLLVLSRMGGLWCCECISTLVYVHGFQGMASFACLLACLRGGVEEEEEEEEEEEVM